MLLPRDVLHRHRVRLLERLHVGQKLLLLPLQLLDLGSELLVLVLHVQQPEDPGVADHERPERPRRGERQEDRAESLSYEELLFEEPVEPHELVGGALDRAAETLAAPAATLPAAQPAPRRLGPLPFLRS